MARGKELIQDLTHIFDCTFVDQCVIIGFLFLELLFLFSVITFVGF